MKHPTDRPLSFWVTLARMGFEEDLARLMEKNAINKTDLANAAGVSPPFITKVLNGTNNYTLKTMAKLARAVGAVLEVRLADENGEVVRILDLATAATLEEAKAASPAAPTSSITYLEDYRAGARGKVRSVSSQENEIAVREDQLFG